MNQAATFSAASSLWFHFHRYQDVRRGDQLTMIGPARGATHARAQGSFFFLDFFAETATIGVTHQFSDPLRRTPATPSSLNAQDRVEFDPVPCDA